MQLVLCVLSQQFTTTRIVTTIVDPGQYTFACNKIDSVHADHRCALVAPSEAVPVVCVRSCPGKGCLRHACEQGAPRSSSRTRVRLTGAQSAARSSPRARVWLTERMRSFRPSAGIGKKVAGGPQHEVPRETEDRRTCGGRVGGLLLEAYPEAVKERTVR